MEEIEQPQLQTSGGGQAKEVVKEIAERSFDSSRAVSRCDQET